MRRVRLLAVVLATGLTVLAAPAKVQAGTVLISADEAKLPPPKGAIAVASRGITRGPKIEILNGTDSKQSPIRLQLKFESFGGAKIDTDTVKVIYMKSPSVDLTQRLKPFVQPTGIDMPDAELPAGDHMIRVDLKDSDGRTATQTFTLKIAP